MESSNKRHEVHQVPDLCQVVRALFSVNTLATIRHYSGFPYVALTLFLSIRFLIATESILSNDLFWSDFNASSGGIYVADAFNRMLLNHEHLRIQLTSPEYATFGMTTTTKPQISFSSTYARTLLYHRLNTARQAITSLRRQESQRHLLFQQTQFCWVDLNQQFSLAHTAKREQRCLANETTNGAVYLETYLRNLDSVSFLQSWQTEYTNGFVEPLKESAEGRAFLASIEGIWKRSSKLSVDEEMAYWQSKGITHFTMQWGNLLVPGVTERIDLVSALGSHVNFTIKTQSPMNPGRRTTMKMYWTPANDFWAVGNGTTAISGMSLVRGTSKFYENFNISMEQVIVADGTLPWPLTPKDQVLRATLGPFGSIDMKQLLCPDSLFELVMNTTHIVNQVLLGDFEAQNRYRQIPEISMFSVFPAAWRPYQEESSDFVWGYLGGNPLCGANGAVPYATQFIEYSDACMGNAQELIFLSRLALVVSLIAENNPSEATFDTICNGGTLETETCAQCVRTASQFVNTHISAQDQQTIRSLAGIAREDFLKLNPELIQFAVNNSNASHFELLRQPVLSSDPDDVWNVFGWWYAVEWATGYREVIRLEGDEGFLTLMSAPVPLSSFEVDKSEIPSSISLSFLRVVQYTTLVSIVCAFLSILYGVTNRGCVAGANLLEFNRVVGAVWIGRPLLIARGVVAVVMISTSRVILNVHGDMAKLDQTRKPWYNVLIAAGESCWFSYVTTDIIVTFTQGYTYRYALLGGVFSQVASALLEMIKPFEHSAEINLQCEMTVFYENVLCHSGHVAIGSLMRFITIAVIAVGITLLMLVVMRSILEPLPAIPGGNVLLAGLAKEVYSSTGWIHDGQWHLDKASAVLTGLVTVPTGRFCRVLDVKTWTLLYLKNNRLNDVEPPDMPKSIRSNQLVPSGGKSEKRKSLPLLLKDTMALTLGFDRKVNSLENLVEENESDDDGASRKHNAVMPLKAPVKSAWGDASQVVPSRKGASGSRAISRTPRANATSGLNHQLTLGSLRHVVGFPYVLMTLFLNIQFLVLSTPSLKTDLFWDDFNATSGGLFVANAFNTMLPNRRFEQIVLTDPEFMLLGALDSHIRFSSAYPRTLLYHRLNTLEKAITSLRRKEGTYGAILQMTQFCWVDFDRNFSVAHTAKRAERCLAREITNGAVYLESLLRNFDSTAFLDSFGDMYMSSIDEPLKESAEGRAFRETLWKIWNESNPLSVDEEMAYWQSKGITHFTMQWGNYMGPGVTERISLVSALGVSQNFTIKRQAPVNPGQRTTMKLFWLPVDDLWATGVINTTVISGMSLIRRTSRFYENFNISMEQVVFNDGTLPVPLTPMDQMIRNALGPFGSIDIKQLMYEDSMFDLVMNTTRIINQQLLTSSSAQELYGNVTENVALSVFPSSWRPLQEKSSDLVWSYLGGSLLCSLGQPVLYAQQLLEYSDECVGSTQEVVRRSRVMQVISLLAMGNPPRTELERFCESGTLEIDTCVASLATTSQFINTYLPPQDRSLIRELAGRARDDLLRVNPELIQLAVNNSNSSHYELLRQPVMSTDPTDPWNMFGWWYAIGWVTGHREVVRFEGDDGTLTLISAEVPFVTVDVVRSEIPSSMSSSLLRVVQYTTLVLLLCASLVFIYVVTSRGHIAGTNLLQFNRVAGAVWIGRPLLIARAIVAVCILSTSHVILAEHGSLTKLDETRKPWYNVIIAAGESCWLSYVTTDILVSLTQGYTYPYAVVSGLVSQLIIALIDFVSPLQHHAVIDLQCENMVFCQDISCHSGRIQIGSVSRLITVALVPIAVTLLMMAVVRCVVSPVGKVEGGSMLLAGIAKEMYSSDGWVHGGRWYLDKASAVLTGLVTFRWGGQSRVLDVKTWTLLYLKSNRLFDAAPWKTSSLIREDPFKVGANDVLPAKVKNAMALSLGFDSDAKMSKEEMEFRLRRSMGFRRSQNEEVGSKSGESLKQREQRE